MPRLRRRAAGLAFGAGVLFVVGTSVQAGWILVLSALLFGCILVGVAVPIFVVRRVRVERRAPSEAFQGDEIAVELLVTNGARGLKVGVEIDDRHLSRTRVALPVMSPRSTVAVAGRRRAARRGVRTTSRATVRSSWPFGVAVARRRVAAASRTIVYPSVERLGETPLTAWTPSNEHSVHSAPRRGTGPEYLGIREYRAGDSMRHVHWPSTARTGHVMVREFEQEHTRRLAIVVDTAADEGTRDTALDRSCSVAASVAFAAVARGRGVRLAAAADGDLQTLARTEPARMLEWLAGLRASGGLPVAEAIDRLRGELRGIETLLLVVPTWRSNRHVAGSVASLTRAVPTVAVALVGARAHAEPDRPSIALEVDEEDALASDLAAAGADVYRIVRGEELSACLGRAHIPA